MASFFRIQMTLLRFSQAHDDIEPPSYAHGGDAGFDIRAAVSEYGLHMDAYMVYDIPTGLRFEIPEGFELQIRPRSGMSKQIVILNAPGTIDEGYRGELFVRASARLGQLPFIYRGMRIAQAVLAPVYRADLQRVAEISIETARGEGGFGSTGA